MEVTLYKLPEGNWQIACTRHVRGDILAKTDIDLTDIDFKDGRVDIDVESNEIVERLAMTFAIAVLYVLCVPRPSNWEDGTPLSSNIQVDGLKLIHASGLMRQTPSNYYIKSHFRTLKPKHDHKGNKTKRGDDTVGKLKSGNDHKQKKTKDEDDVA